MLKKIFILIGIILLGVLSLFAYTKFKQSKNTTLNTAEDKSFFANFIPFGEDKQETQSNDIVDTPIDISSREDGVDVSDKEMKLSQISSSPVAGFVVYQKERYKNIPAPEDTVAKKDTKNKPSSPATESIPAIRYVDKATGFIFQTFADKIDVRQFSSTIIPKVAEAYFANNGETIVMQYSKENNYNKDSVITFIGALPKEYLGADSSETNKITGSFLPENIIDLSVSKDTSNIFYMFKTGEITTGISMKASTTTKKSQIFDSPFSEWTSEFADNKTILLTTKPSSGVDGVSYMLDSENKSFTKILNNIKGLVTLPNANNKKILYSNGDLVLNIYNTQSGGITNVSLRTIAEKCVWNKGGETIYCAVPKISGRGEYPDIWYQGEFSFDDAIWKIDAETGNTTMLTDLSILAGQEIDAVKLDIDENQNYLFFINKKDSQLWKLNLR